VLVVDLLDGGSFPGSLEVLLEAGGSVAGSLEDLSEVGDSVAGSLEDLSGAGIFAVFGTPELGLLFPAWLLESWLPELELPVLSSCVLRGGACTNNSLPCYRSNNSSCV
jgi:hypothetical protein